MLNHTSGLPPGDTYEWDRPQFDDGAAERYIRSLTSETLLWAPGGGWRYSDLGPDIFYQELDEKLRTTGHVDHPPRVSDIYPPGPLQLATHVGMSWFIGEHAGLRTVSHAGVAIQDLTPFGALLRRPLEPFSRSIESKTALARNRRLTRSTGMRARSDALLNRSTVLCP
jgi:hypothetical protein